jgi:hypothetical protein
MLTPGGPSRLCRLLEPGDDGRARLEVGGLTVALGDWVGSYQHHVDKVRGCGARLEGGWGAAACFGRCTGRRPCAARATRASAGCALGSLAERLLLSWAAAPRPGPQAPSQLPLQLLHPSGSCGPLHGAEACERYKRAPVADPSLPPPPPPPPPPQPLLPFCGSCHMCHDQHVLNPCRARLACAARGAGASFCDRSAAPGSTAWLDWPASRGAAAAARLRQGALPEACKGGGGGLPSCRLLAPWRSFACAGAGRTTSSSSATRSWWSAARPAGATAAAAPAARGRRLGGGGARRRRLRHAAEMVGSQVACRVDRPWGGVLARLRGTM